MRNLKEGPKEEEIQRKNMDNEDFYLALNCSQIPYIHTWPSGESYFKHFILISFLLNQRWNKLQKVTQYLQLIYVFGNAMITTPKGLLGLTTRIFISHPPNFLFFVDTFKQKSLNLNKDNEFIIKAIAISIRSIRSCPRK